MKRYLIMCYGFIGDCLFASSVAKKLKDEGQASQVDFLIPFVQPKLLLEENTYIDHVYVQNLPSMNYDKIIRLNPVNQAVPATIGFQKDAGVRNPSVEYKLTSLAEHDYSQKIRVDKLRELYPNKKLVCWVSNWSEKAYNTEPDMLFETPKRGGSHRDITHIVSELEKDFCMVEVGLPPGVQQYDKRAMDATDFSLTASFIKLCDYCIGNEGGITNTAAGLGTKCIITTDFIYQVYGPMGFMKQISEPQMGPATYFPDAGHSHLPPFIKDEEVIEWIKYLINNDKSYVYNAKTYDTNRGYVKLEDIK